MFYRFLIIIYKRKREYKTEYAWTVNTRYPLSGKLDEVQVIAASGELRICNHWRFVISAAGHFVVETAYSFQGRISFSHFNFSVRWLDYCSTISTNCALQRILCIICKSQMKKWCFVRTSFFYGKLFWKFLCIVWNKINFWRLDLGACFWSSCHTFHWNFTTFLLLWSLKGFNYMKSFICPQNEFRSLSMVQWIRVFTPLIYVLNCVVISASEKFDIFGWSMSFGSFFLIAPKKANLSKKFCSTWSTLCNNTYKGALTMVGVHYW